MTAIDSPNAAGPCTGGDYPPGCCRPRLCRYCEYLHPPRVLKCGQTMLTAAIRSTNRRRHGGTNRMARRAAMCCGRSGAVSFVVASRAQCLPDLIAGHLGGARRCRRCDHPRLGGASRPRAFTRLAFVLVACWRSSGRRGLRPGCDRLQAFAAMSTTLTALISPNPRCEQPPIISLWKHVGGVARCCQRALPRFIAWSA